MTTPEQSADRILLPDFERWDVDTGAGIVAAWVAGSGPPLLMLHGDPQTHLCWHTIAPELLEDFTVVLTDIRGRGEADKPPASETHEPYSKRAMGQQQIDTMAALSFDRFDLVGHDRGARVARRMTLDHPSTVRSLVCMDIIPAIDLYEATTAQFAQDYWYFWFLIQPHPIPERLISGDPTSFMRELLLELSTGDNAFHPIALDAYLETAATPESIEAMCECFRAGVTIDAKHDRADRQTQRTANCPTLVMWGDQGVLARHVDVASIWNRWATDLTAIAMPSGHFIPEEAPREVVAQLRTFYARNRGR